MSKRGASDAWQPLISTVFEPTAPSSRPRKDLRAEACVTCSGDLPIMQAAAEAQHFTRAQRLITAEDMDHDLIQHYRSGVCDGTSGDVSNTVRPGAIKTIDLARPFHTFNTDFDKIPLTIPRAALAPLLARLDSVHGTVLHRNWSPAPMLASRPE